MAQVVVAEIKKSSGGQANSYVVSRKAITVVIFWKSS